MVHIEVDAVSLILNTARLVINRLGEQVCPIRGNRADANGSRIGNQVNAALLINVNLFGIVWKTGKGFFAADSSTSGTTASFITTLIRMLKVMNRLDSCKR
jgi:hypothetical protein